MFRHRIQSTLTEEEKTSSLTNGRASIIIPEKTSEDVAREHQQQQQQQQQPQLAPVAELPKGNEPITIDNMSAMIAAAVQVSSTQGAKSSLSMGHASIVPQERDLNAMAEDDATKANNSKVKRRFSLFAWKKKEEEPLSTSSSSSTSSTSSPRSSSSLATTPVDDGLDELVSRGIQIKEIKTTLKPMVIPNAVSNPMPEVKLERPGFARISY
ncbi:hypothetical protein BC940DRAFT_370913 [Gongronella butleri]|nr:hypothetical protein BC940DRAFT_370913 [Gongronella butleri]